MSKTTDYEKAYNLLKGFFNSKGKPDKPKKRKKIKGEIKHYCKYLDAGMEGLHCPKGYEYEGTCRYLNGYECPLYEPEYNEKERALAKEIFKELDKVLTIDPVHPWAARTYLLPFDDYLALAKKFGIKIGKKP